MHNLRLYTVEKFQSAHVLQSSSDSVIINSEDFCTGLQFLLTSTVWSPTLFPACMLRTLSSKNIWDTRTRKEKYYSVLWHKSRSAAKMTVRDNLTVLWGLTSAILSACSMASSDGLQTTGVFGNPKPRLGPEKCPMMSKISELPLLALPGDSTNSTSSSSPDATLPRTVFNVSKQMIPSKQSSRLSLLKTFAAWILSPFVNIWPIHRMMSEVFQGYSWITVSFGSDIDGEAHTILRYGRLSKRLRSTGSGFKFS